ncbi:PAS domain-containing sensor histidine kinase [Aridibaculum aurantiacum]|uniref:PAS domain-containing sensor histidine kinase n=1 Tax=Aridibaculum aurantiacum TaxID=2810307 RepID=UPI001A959B82|nr:ATP-binding protein [Aridibaculum aurantiacum]
MHQNRNEWAKNEQGFVKTMLDASIHAILLLEPLYEQETIRDFCIKAANRALTAHAGLQPADVVGSTLSSIFPHYKEYEFYDLYLQVISTSKMERKQLYYKDAKLEGWFDVGVAPHEEGLVVTFANITELVTFQKDLEKQTSHLNTIINTAQSGIFMFAPKRDEKGEIVDFVFTNVNPSLASYVGEDPGRLLGDLGSTWFPAYKTNGLFESYKRTLETGNTERFEFHYNDDGIDVWLDILATRVGGEVLVTFTDHTPMKRLQLQLEETVHELKRSNANLQDFAYIASHDLQEPLRKITFFADKVKQRYRSEIGPEGEAMVERIESASARMGTLINDLLEFSKVSSSLSALEQVSLQEIFDDVLSDFEATVQQKQATIHVDPLPETKADAVMMSQLFQNLLSNSLKYQRPGVAPVININYKKTIAAETRLKVRSDDMQRIFHVISISDNGVGFDQQHAERIFQIFQRLHGRAEYPGTGVGLAIVQKVVAHHRGYIEAFGEPGKGATFVILLPAK